MDAVLGAWGLGADIGIAGRAWKGRDKYAGLPPMSSRHAGSIELFPFLLFDHVFIDDRSFKALLADGISGFALSTPGRDFLRELHRQRIVRPVDYTAQLRDDVDRIRENAHRILSAENLAALLVDSRILWEQFLETPGARFHPGRSGELRITRNEIRLLRHGLPGPELQRSAAHDVFDAVTMTVLSEKLDAAVCDWSMYKPFYDEMSLAALDQNQRVAPNILAALHETLDLYIPTPTSVDAGSVLRLRESTVMPAFRRYAQFLERPDANYSVADFISLRRRLLSAEGRDALAAVNVFPSFNQRAPVFSEDYVRTVVRSELADIFAKTASHPVTTTQVFQLIRGGTIDVGDKYIAGQAGAMGPNAAASNISFQQVWLQVGQTVDLATLAQELGTLREAMRQRATTPEQDIGTGNVAAAEKAAGAGDGAAVLQHLAHAGTWALQCARDIGVELAAEITKRALGLG
jgi:hypothetical protein